MYNRKAIRLAPAPKFSRDEPELFTGLRRQIREVQRRCRRHVWAWRHCLHAPSGEAASTPSRRWHGSQGECEASKMKSLIWSEEAVLCDVLLWLNTFPYDLGISSWLVRNKDDVHVWAHCTRLLNPKTEAMTVRVLMVLNPGVYNESDTPGCVGCSFYWSGQGWS